MNLDWPFKKKDGEKIWFMIAGDPVADEDEVLWTVVDITQRVKAQNKIEQLTSQLSKYLSPQVYKSIFSGRKNVKLKHIEKNLQSFFQTFKALLKLLID